MYMNRAIKLKQASKQKIKYKEGEVVRIQYKRGPFTRGYDEQAGSQRYIIKRIDSKSRHQNKLLYAFSSTNFSNQTLG